MRDLLHKVTRGNSDCFAGRPRCNSIRTRQPPKAYNQAVVFNFFSSRSGRALRLSAISATALALAAAAAAHGQNRTAPVFNGEAAHGANGRILLVLPFDNETGQLSLDWMREAAAELLDSRFSSAGFSPLNREDRMYALDHLGLPEAFQPSRATAIKLAQTLDAGDIVVGSY
jgi:hypothetical protein